MKQRELNSQVVRDLNEFKRLRDMIIAKRISEKPQDAAEKVYTRNIFDHDD